VKPLKRSCGIVLSVALMKGMTNSLPNSTGTVERQRFFRGPGKNVTNKERLRPDPTRPMRPWPPS
jgi:hypothetical protein